MAWSMTAEPLMLMVIVFMFQDSGLRIQDAGWMGACQFLFSYPKG
jgi:hypothetical protein